MVNFYGPKTGFFEGTMKTNMLKKRNRRKIKGNREETQK
jgi:hypothetical protein